MRILVISSVLPEPTTAGSLILYRHLVNRPNIRLEVLAAEPAKCSSSGILRRFAHILERMGGRRLADDLSIIWNGRWLDPLLPQNRSYGGDTLVLTVAHGDACFAALRYAKRFDLPLVTFFHDWMPDVHSPHNWFRSRLRFRFLELYKASDLALCVSPAMREHLGAHLNAAVLYPIPPKVMLAGAGLSRQNAEHKLFRILYAGNLGDYGLMLGDALQILKDHPTIRLEVRGSSPVWSTAFSKEMHARGLWLPFAPREDLQRWLASADAFLVPQLFDAAQKRRMETNFPSKITEFTQYGKPIVIWAPEYASAAKWALGRSDAIIVPSPSQDALLRSLESLQTDKVIVPTNNLKTDEYSSLSFLPETIQQQFEQALINIVSAAQ